MRVVKVAKKIRLTFTNEELEQITERNSLDIDMGYLRILFDDISKIIVEILPTIKQRKKK